MSYLSKCDSNMIYCMNTMKEKIDKIESLEKELNNLLKENNCILNGMSDVMTEIKAFGEKHDKKVVNNFLDLKKDLKTSWADVVKNEMKNNINVVNTEVKSLSNNMLELKKEVSNVKNKVETNYDVELRATNGII